MSIGWWTDAERICNCGPGRETVCHQMGTEPHFVGCPRWGTPTSPSAAEHGAAGTPGHPDGTESAQGDSRRNEENR